MSKQKPPRYPVNPKDFDTLSEIGYQITKFSEYHYRIGLYGEPEWKQIDVWPTSRKLMRRDGEYKVEHYTNLVETIEKMF